MDGENENKNEAAAPVKTKIWKKKDVFFFFRVFPSHGENENKSRGRRLLNNRILNRIDDCYSL